MSCDELEFIDSPVPLRKPLKLTEGPRSIFNSMNSKSTVSNSQLSLPESTNTPSKFQPFNKHELMDTAVFDSPSKRIQTSRLDTPQGSMHAVEDFSYREILKGYNISHKKTVSEPFPMKLSHHFGHKKSPINQINSFKPKLISSLRRSEELSKKYVGLERSSVIPAHKNALSGICVYDNKIWTVGLDYKLNCWDYCRGYKNISRVAHRRGIIGIIVHKNSLVTACKDGVIKYWTNTGCRSLKAHQGSIKSLASVAEFVLTGGDSIKVWAGQVLVKEFSHCASYSLSSIKDQTFLVGSEKSLKLFDLRIHNSLSEFEAVGPFFSCLKWDEHSFWSGSDCELVKWDLRTCGILQKLKTSKINSICKAGNSLITASDYIGIMDCSQIYGPFTSVFYNEKSEVLYAGRRSGELDILKFV